MERPRINVFSEPETLDTFIKENLKFRLLDYAHVLAEVLMESFWGHQIMGMKKSSVKNELSEIKTIKKSTLRNLRNYLRDYPVSKSYEEMISRKEKNDFITNEFKLKPLFDRLDLREEILSLYKYEDYETKKGRPLEKRFKIASLWASAIKREDEISWGNIVRLLKWFYRYLERTEYGPEIRTRASIGKEADLFKDQCLQIHKKLDYFKIIVVSLRLFFIKVSYPKTEFSIHSIVFEDDSIEVNKIFQKYSLMQKTKMEFIKDKKFFSSDLIELPAQKKEPFIVFPNGVTFVHKPSV